MVGRSLTSWNRGVSKKSPNHFLIGPGELLHGKRVRHMCSSIGRDPLANPHHASPAGRGHGPFLRMTSPTNPRCRLACFAPHPGKPSGEIAPLPQLLASTWMLGPGSLPTWGQWWCWLIRMLAWEALTRFDSKLLRRTSRGADNRHLASSRDWQRCCCFHHVYLRGILLFFNVSALEYIQQPRHLCY